jgi:hypothetical protein
MGSYSVWLSWPENQKASPTSRVTWSRRPLGVYHSGAPRSTAHRV